MIIPKRIRTREKFSELSNHEKEQLDDAITGFLKSHENELYLPKDLLIELGLNFNLHSFIGHLRDPHRKMGLLKVEKLPKVEKEVKQFYGFSTYCGSNECYYDWCKGFHKLCPKGTPNPNLRFYERFEKNSAKGIYSADFNCPEVVYGDFDKIKLFKVKPGGVLPDHVDNYHHLIIVTGEGIFSLEGEEYKMKAGYVIAVKAGEMHGYRNVSNENLELIVCNTKTV